MATVVFVHPDGAESRVDARPGASVMETAKAHGIEEIHAECGGSAVCGTCHVFVEQPDPASFGPMLALEDELLDFAATPRQPNSRLSCQLRIPDGDVELVIGLPPAQV